jgi:predicted dehydrogenase
MTKKTKVVLIGASDSGRVYPENLAFCILQAELVAISDVFVKAAEKYTADYQIPTVYSDHHFILTDNSIKAVPTCFSTDAHTQLILPPF